MENPIPQVLPAHTLMPVSAVDAYLLTVLSAAAIYVACSLVRSSLDSLKHIPIVNNKKWYSLSGRKAKARFLAESSFLLEEARKRYPQQPFRILSNWGVLLVLPSCFADEIRNDRRLSFSKAALQDSHGHIPGLETVKLVARDDQLIQTVARKHLTKHLCKTPHESEHSKTEFALDVNFGQSREWYTITLKPAILDIIARISSRIYLGDELCRNTEWLAVTKVYTSAFFAAPVKLGLVPAPLRRFAHWFIPECKILREQVQEARRIIGPIVRRRQVLQAKALSEGCPAPQFHDALGWAAEESAKNGMDYDPAVTQLALSMLAIHTTYDLFQQCILDLAQNPHFIEPLRQEALEVVRQYGWTKQGLYHMKLLDSALKETQRLKPGSMVTMRRYVLEDLQLSNGLLLKKGTRINVDNQRMRDPDLHEDPRKYDAFRFYKMRQQPGGEHTAQLVSTSQDHLGFGHGEHSCPGRFFAANEIKVAMAHMLIKYEWKPAESSSAGPDVKGLLMKSGAGAQIDIRRREAVAIEGRGI
ncbi:P450 monooxygenase [Elsinoe ampelina]|uniref:P450 monooxygenase n=1 Tax=Elsinoe ampelina TaxID=302913 RepID=A0A6A6GDT1_9PEZI|nr:P450 monooxygenase [Elsinoe ampelina]